MFIYAMRASTARFLISLVLLFSVTLGLGVVADAGAPMMEEVESVVTISYGRAGSDEARLSFLASLGWETTGEVIAEESFTLPETFDRVMAGYNEIQKNQGLDLSRYRKKKVTRYTYEITNFEGYEGRVFANLIIYRGKVVAGDVSSADPMGFVQGLERDVNKS